MEKKTMPDEIKQRPMQSGARERIGTVTSEVASISQKPEGLSEAQNALREATLNHFKANKVRSFITKHVQFINSKRQVAESIRFLFDEHGRPPANAPLEDIIAERKKIEADIRWFEAMCSELRNKLVQVKEIEDLALELMEKQKVE
jgi:hypothetical protein